MKLLRRILLVLLLIIVVVAVGGFAVYWDSTRSVLPQHAGSLNVAGLEAQVEILRDVYGVPHIYASSPHDLFFAQGYSQAQDRWWQMEFWRHTAAGRIQELTGQNDDLMGTDTFIRTVGWRRDAELSYQAADEPTKAALQAFADGVNAYITSRAPHHLAMEYRLLGVTGVSITIEPWTPVDSVSWGKVMAWDLTDSRGSDLLLGRLIENLGAEMAVDYIPPYPYGEHPTIVQPDDLAAASAASSLPATAADMGNYAARELVALFSGNATAEGIGSNNWVAAGSMTLNGTPLLANDPHLGTQMPSIWYEVGLHCLPKTETCPFDLVGFAFSAAPGVIVGHNDRIAWGVTNGTADVQDLYRLTINPENELQYEWDGTWRDMTTREETIRFGDSAETLTITVRETHLGPILNDNQIDLETGRSLGFNNTNPVAMKWTGSGADTLFGSVLQIDLATDWESFRDALRLWNIPSQNFVYADVDGNIGYQLPGNMPIRPAGYDGSVPIDQAVPAMEWQGFIPFDELPMLYNPARGWIESANQAVAPLAYYDGLTERLGADATYNLSYNWSYGYRGARVEQMINEYAPHSIDSFRRMQLDNVSLAARDILPTLAALDMQDGLLNDMRNWLTGWDGAMNAESGQAALWAILGKHLVDSTFADQLGDDQPGNEELFALSRLLDEPDNVWWDDSTTPDVVETRDETLRRAFAAANAEAFERLGENRDVWRWDAIHTVTLISNPLGQSGIAPIEDIFNRGPIGVAGGYETVNAASYSLSDYTMRAGTSMRMIVDVGNFDNSLTTHPTGQSGHPFSADYDNLIEQWAGGQYKPMHFTRAAVERATRDRLVLSP